MKHTPASISRNAEASGGDSERRVLSQRELAKEKRHAMYQSAKARRATDPRYLALKEAAKVQRRAAYQKVKDRRNAVAGAAKAQKKAVLAAECTRRRSESDKELMGLVSWVVEGSIPQND